MTLCVLLVMESCMRSMTCVGGVEGMLMEINLSESIPFEREFSGI